MKYINSQIQEAPESLSTRNIKKTAPKHIIIKLFMTSYKQKILKAAPRKRHIIYRKAKMETESIFFLVTMQARRQWSDILRVLKEEKRTTST